ncbi:MAG: nucleotidyltransferase domain-containing protein [Bacteroidia bacterium]|nr:nucleotidyltransferase domain-containing protein [Bacteroidia bacterium]
MIHPNVQKHLDEIIRLLQNHFITRAYLFGSAVQNNFNDLSDIDFLVSIDEKLPPEDAGEHLWNLTYELEGLLGRHVDVLTERSIKNLYFLNEINKSNYAFMIDS